MDEKSAERFRASIRIRFVLLGSDQRSKSLFNERINIMKTFHGFTHGVGIGGWMTNYKRLAVIEKSKRMGSPPVTWNIS